MTEINSNSISGLVWPKSARRLTSGEVEIAGIKLTDLAREYSTPLFVMDKAEFIARCREFAGIFADTTQVHYAAKAFSSTQVFKWIETEGLSLDVCTGGELFLALQAKFPPNRISMHGNNKSIAELNLAVENEIGYVVVDSLVEIEKLNQIAKELNKIQQVLIRISVGVHAHTHEYIATAHEDQKFGFSISNNAALEAVQAVLRSDNLKLVGLHSHIGSQILEISGFEVAAQRLLELLQKIKQIYGNDIANQLRILNLGGGFGIAYTTKDKPLNIKKSIGNLIQQIEDQCNNIGIPCPRIEIEPGRAIVGPSMVTVYEVGSIKTLHLDNGISRRYISVDGGMSDNIRPALYGAEYEARIINRSVTGSNVLTRVVGKHCETGDILVKDINLPVDIVPGDYLALPATGAYCYVLSSRYNQIPRPAVVVVAGGIGKLMLRRETYADLLSLEVE